MYTMRVFSVNEIALSNEIRSKFIEIEGLLERVPKCREKSIALSHIEDAMLHSNIAISDMGGENNEVNNND